MSCAVHGAKNMPGCPGCSYGRLPPRGAKAVWCCYCKSMKVTPGRADDHLTVTIAGDTRIAILNGEQLIVQDGSCAECSARLKASVTA